MGRPMGYEYITHSCLSLTPQCLCIQLQSLYLRYHKYKQLFNQIEI